MEAGRYRESEALFERAWRVVPGGIYGHQSPTLLVPGAYPYFFTRGAGARLWDVDGHEYVDLMCAYGPIVLGHNHPTVLLRTPLGVRISQRVWVRGQCTCTILAESFLRQYGVEPKADPVGEFKHQFNMKVGNPQIVLAPSFNDLLGGMPVNGDAPKSMLSPILRPGAVSMDEFDVNLLDGTYLGTVRFLRTLA